MKIVPRESDFAVNSPAWDFRFHSTSSASVRLPLRRGIARASHPMKASRSLLARCSARPGATCRWPCAPGMPGFADAHDQHLTPGRNEERACRAAALSAESRVLKIAHSGSQGRRSAARAKHPLSLGKEAPQ